MGPSGLTPLAKLQTNISNCEGSELHYKPTLAYWLVLPLTAKLMRRTLHGTRLALALVTLATFMTTAAAAAQSIAITHVNVIDVASGTLLSDRTVVFTSGRIVSVAPAKGAVIPSGSRRINGRGKFLIPGLWDMHVHVFGNVSRPGTDTHDMSFPLYLANGVTGLRDMWTDLEDIRVVEGWRRDAAGGRMIMPAIVTTSTPVDGAPPLWPTSTVISSPDVARHFVDSLVNGGARTIKMLEPSPEVFYAVAAEVKKLGIDFVGHVPPELHASDASNAGMRSIEHLFSIPEACTGNEQLFDSLMATPAMRRQNRIHRLELLTTMYDANACDRIAKTLVMNHTWVVPTNVTTKGRSLAFEDAAMTDPRLRFAAATDIAEWSRFHQAEKSASDSLSVSARRKLIELRRRIVGRLYRDGVSMMTGTDIGNPFIVAGFSVHDELVEFARAGLTPAQALRTATLDPARFLHATDSLGTIQPGKRADLVLLDANPLVDIRNTTHIRAVVVNGNVLDRAKLDSLLSVAARLSPLH